MAREGRRVDIDTMFSPHVKASIIPWSLNLKPLNRIINQDTPPNTKKKDDFTLNRNEETSELNRNALMRRSIFFSACDEDQNYCPYFTLFSRRYSEVFFKSPSKYSYATLRKAVEFLKPFFTSDNSNFSEIGYKVSFNYSLKSANVLQAEEIIKHKFYEVVFEVVKFNVLSQYQVHKALIFVILHDCRLRRFLRRVKFSHEESDPDIEDLENVMVKMRTKFNAAFARLRIKRNAKSLDDLIPSSPCIYRIARGVWKDTNNNSKARLSLWAWVNRNKHHVSIQSIINELQNEGITVTPLHDPGIPLPYLFSERHVADILCFLPCDKERLLWSRVLKKDILVVQESVSCLGPQCLRKALALEWEKKNIQKPMSPNSLILARLLNKPRPPPAPVLGKTDVVITNIGIGKTAVYLSSLLVECGFEDACHLLEHLARREDEEQDVRLLAEENYRVLDHAMK
ncbi:uncharacterized protein LOC111089626, partial [Limulus polyphemus]|uniref:Uncharacterized protein LOC111089626 n=1 Tax=Limulus polyphemus TaxID=6850 RepID=A0ABM1TQN5_LIMPO